MKLAVLVSWCVLLIGCGAVPKQPSPPPSSTSVPTVPPSPTAPAPAPTSSSPPTVPPSQANASQCAAGEYDMLDWATMDPDLAAGYHLEGNANPLYTVVEKDKFYWLKGANGYPWDIQLYDNNNIYLWITEQNWTDPHAFKKSLNNTNMPLTARCAKGGQPGTTVKSNNTSFTIVSSCTNAVVSNLGYMINETWGPNKQSLGGTLPDHMDVLTVSYRYNCDASYSNCQDREEFYFSQRYGLVKWDHGKLANGQYVQDQFTVYNQLKPGGPPTVEFPCN